HVNMGTYGKEIAHLQTRGELSGFSTSILNRNARTHVRVTIVDNHSGGESRTLIHLLLHSPLVDIAEFDFSANLGQDGNGVWIPFCQQISRLDAGAVFLLQFGPIDDGIALSLS